MPWLRLISRSSSPTRPSPTWVFVVLGIASFEHPGHGRGCAADVQSRDYHRGLVFVGRRPLRTEPTPAGCTTSGGIANQMPTLYRLLPLVGMFAALGLPGPSTGLSVELFSFLGGLLLPSNG